MHIAPQRLQEILTTIFIAAGADVGAEQIAESLVENNLVGHDCHGAMRVEMYTKMMDAGRIDPRGQITAVRESATTALIDGGLNFGILVARQAMDMAMAKAQEHDLGMVVARNCGHTGRMGEYVVRAAQEGFIGIVMGSGSARGGTMAPFGGIDRAFNTNPISWGVPAKEHPPLFFDFATSAVAYGKIQVAQDKRIAVPEGWILNAEGQPTTDPDDLGKGGVLLPFGGHKGSALALMVELLSNGLTIATCSPLTSYEPDFTMMLMAIRIEAFQPLEQFCCMVDETIDAIKAGRKAPGVEEILVPGEPEWRIREQRLRDGIDLPEGTWQRIVASGARYGVTVKA